MAQQTIAQRIAEINQQIRYQEDVLRSLQVTLANTKALQVLCPHEFELAPKGYEHEGGTCMLCGCNEIHAASLKRMHDAMLAAHSKQEQH